jgi:glutamine synthetase
MTQATDTQELAAFLETHPDTRLIELLSPDMNGILRGKRVGPDDFKKIFAGGVNFCASTVLLDSKGAVCERLDYGSRDGDPDLLGRAVSGTLAPVPWMEKPVGQVILELWNVDGTPYFGDPRQVLRRAMQPLTDLGLHPVVATELEFYFLENDGSGFKPRYARIPGSKLPQEGLQFASLDELIDIDPFLTALDQTCRLQNIPNGAALAEYAPGQFEINLAHVNDPTLACDHAVLLKRAIKAVARQHELAASFMAKPFADYSGCGMHVHISLLDDAGKNVFAGECADGAFSDTLRHAIGGMARSMAESMAIFAPNANSYKRYSNGSYTSLVSNWGTNHRDLSLRIPLSSAKNTRVEHRVSGADTNPYLSMAAILAGIHHGISNQIDPGTMVQTGEVLKDEQANLPYYWEAALDRFESGKILPDYLGEYHQVFASCRREECDQFRSEIGSRDFEWYLRGG